MRYKNIAGRFLGLVTKHACDRQTDGQTTDGQNYDSQDRASIAASRGKKHREKPTYIRNKSSAVAEMGDRGHNRHRPKRGCCVRFVESWDPV